MDMRELKGLELAARCRIDFRDGAWLVPSQSGNGTYRVTLSPEGDACPCDNFSLTGQPCKHVHAARLVRQREHNGQAPAINTDKVPKRPTYAQDWVAYNQAQSIERDRFHELLADLCRGIKEPPAPKTGRRPHLARDAVFAMAAKVYSTFSERRFSCELADSHAKGYLTKPIPGMKVHAFFDKPALATILQELIVRSSLPLRSVETAFAPDSSGFSTSRFVRWYDEKYGIHRSGKDWVKVHIMCGVRTNVVTAVEIHDRDAGDSPQFKALVEKTAENFTVQRVSADKAYLSRDNLAVVAGLGGEAFIPFKVNSLPGEAGSLWEKAYLYYNLRRDEFLRHYHQRSNVESTFSMVKAKFRDHVRSRTDAAMRNEVLCKFLCHNICCVIQSQFELGIEPVFWGQESADSPNVLPMIRPG